MMLLSIHALLLLIGCLTAHWVEEMENPNLYEGDIVLDPDEKEHLSGENGFASIKGGRWPNARVPYEITSSISSRGRSTILKAFEEYHKHTCLRFFPRKSESSFISFYYGKGCNSPVGYRRGRKNSISLGRGCQYLGTTMHEIGHSIGMYHEQSRPDRDNYVRILWNNIRQFKFAFNKHTTRTIDSLGAPYDFSSMMHYGSTAFGGGRRTIETIDPANQRKIGQRRGFSEIDIKQINLMYCGGVRPTNLPTINPPPNTLAPTGCTNTDRKCDFWASNGYCPESNVKEAKYIEIMKRKCCKACKENAQCRNRNNRCDEWERRGECGKNPNYMHEWCRKACKLCS